MKNTQMSIIKGIGIILMVIGHALNLGMIRDIIYLFHMPLFFITTGYLFKDKYLYNPKLYFFNQLKKQYFTYVKWCIIFLLFHNIFMHIGIMNTTYGYEGSGYEWYSLFQIIKKIIRIILFMTDNEPFLAGFWFIRTLFIASIVLCLVRFLILHIIKYDGNKNIIITIIFLSIILSVFYFFCLKTIFIETKEILAMLFIAIGSFMKRKDITQLNYLMYLSLFAIIYIMVGATNMFANTFIRGIEIILTGTLGWILIFKIAKDRNNYIMKILAYCGDNSLYILIFHLLCFKIPTYIYLFITDTDMQKISMIPSLQIDNPLLITSYTVIGVFLPLVVKYICVKLYKHLIY